MAYDAVQSGRNLPAYQRIVLTPPSGMKIKANKKKNRHACLLVWLILRSEDGVNKNNRQVENRLDFIASHPTGLQRCEAPISDNVNAQY
jgi:hypothetical protein